MIDTVLQSAAYVIQSNVAAVSLSGGVARPVLFRDGSRVRTLPAALADPERSDSTAGDYIALLPTDGQSAVVFWQVVSSIADPRLPSTDYRLCMLARVRLVVWGNKRRLSPPDVNLVLTECASVFRSHRLECESDYIKSVNVVPALIEGRNKSVFGEYTFDEAETQYLTEPYDFASMLFDVQYTVLLNCQPMTAAIESMC